MAHGGRPSRSIWTVLAHVEVGQSKRPWVLGIAASHNGGACLLHGDELVVAVQEERLTRHKRARVVGSQRCLAVDYCLQAAGIDFEAIDAVGFTSPLPKYSESRTAGRSPA